MTIRLLTDKLYNENNLSKTELDLLLRDESDEEYLKEKARETALSVFGNNIYIRGLIEFTNHCHNNCFYCGIRAQNSTLIRYRLNKEEILNSCHRGYKLGYRTFVLQGGEDSFYDDDNITDIIRGIKKEFSDCAITLSIGEKSESSYKKFFEAGATRYLLRHETANEKHYRMLHPENQHFSNRMECLKNLKKIGYQTGCGFMVGSPYQTIENLTEDLIFIKKLNPEMVGIGPFIPHKDTPFKKFGHGSVKMTLKLIAIIRLLLPDVLLPATTALATLADDGRKNAILAGANVIMPNLSPADVRKLYSLYNSKACTGNEAAEEISRIKNELESIGYTTVISRGDYKKTK